jgi:hypothetical protein
MTGEVRPEPAALKAGRERAKRRRQAEARKRVRVYLRWLKAGSPIRQIPPIPSDADFRLSRQGRA